VLQQKSASKVLAEDEGKMMMKMKKKNKNRKADDLKIIGDITIRHGLNSYLQFTQS
jgi:hypothetical protein